MLYVNDIPYLRTVSRTVALNPGSPLGKGNIVFLFTENVRQSIDIMMQRDNVMSRGRMYYYFYQPKYFGALQKKPYRVNGTKTRDQIISMIREETDIHPYPKKNLINSNEQKNTYYDLCGYYAIYNRIGARFGVYKKITAFWDTFRPIFEDSHGQLHKKTVLIRLSFFPPLDHGSIKEKINNPIYLLYMTLYKKFDIIKSLDIDFVIYTSTKVLRVNPAKCDSSSYKKFLVEVRRLYNGIEILGATASEIESAVAEEKEELVKESETAKNVVDSGISPFDILTRGIIKNSTTISMRTDPISGARFSVKNTETPVAQMLRNVKLAGGENKELEKALQKKIDGAIKHATADSVEDIDSVGKPDEDSTSEVSESVEDAEDAINADKELIQRIYEQVTQGQNPKSQRSTARDELLRKEQENIQVNGMTVRDLAEINPKERAIEKTDISKSLTTVNPNMKTVSFNNFNDSYVKNVMTKDMVGVFQELNDKSIRMFIRDIKVEDSSDALNYKETWTVSLEDENRSRHTIKFDIPKFVDKNFLWIGGNTKSIKNQQFFLPLVKISSDTVMLVTNYNKMSIERVDGRSLRELTLLEKIYGGSEGLQEKFKVGSAITLNKDYITCVEYDEYSKNYISFRSGSIYIYFSQKEALEIAKKRNVTVPEKKFFIGFKNNEPLLIDIQTGKTEDGFSISDIIIETLSSEDRAKYTTLQMKVPKRLMYTKVTTMKQNIPIGVLLCVWEGLSSVLKKGKVEYRLVDRLRGSDIPPNSDFIRFKNCYLLYKTDIATELIMNGLKVLDTKAYDVSEMDTPVPYLPYIQKKYGKISIMNALMNVYEFTIGNIEKEILKDMNLPTDLVSLMIYGNSLLADSQFISELDMSEYRIRCAEIIPAILYDTIAKAYVPFKNSGGKKKLSIPQDAVIKKLLALQTVEDYSSLNPFLELETTHGVSPKGWRGVNLEDSYTIPKRSYDKSMTGIIGVSSSPDGQVGVNRTLTMEPTINSVRGYVDVKCDDLDSLKDVNLFSPAEMLIPLGATRDDPIRTGHSVKQSRASVPIKDGSPVLMTNGSDQMCKHYLSSDFVVMAEQDGTVIEYDESTKIMIVEYKDGKHRAINLDKKIVKNGGGGFELSNILTTNLKVGDKFKANDTLAWHKDYFKYIPSQGVRMCVGALIKIALYDGYNMYEDGNWISEKVSEMCETEMVFRRKWTVGKNSNIFDIVSVGDKVAVGDPLIEFDESFEESDINKLLDSLGGNQDIVDAVTENNKNVKKADVSGVIEDIRIYSGSDLEELSPSLQKIVQAYYKKIDKKISLLNKYDKTNSTMKCGMLITEASGKTEPDRYGNIRGEKVHDGVLFEFCIKHAEPLEVGSKVANFSPLKNVVGEVVPKDYEPRSELRPEETIDAMISPSSILNRMVSSINPTIFGNKCIIELKKALYAIWIGAGDFAKKRSQMESLIYRFFRALDKTGLNTKRYKSMFQPMSDAKFKAFFNEFFANEYHYLILDMVDYEATPKLEDIEDAAKVLDIPLYEYIEIPHLNMDNEHPIVTPVRVPVGYLHLKRPQQTVMKKNGLSTSNEMRSAITNQVIGADKNGRESDLENIILISLGMSHTLKELNGPRADDSVAKKEMLQAISTKGYVTLGELTDDVTNKTTLNTVNTYFLGMGLKTDLISKGLKLPTEIDKE